MRRIRSVLAMTVTVAVVVAAATALVFAVPAGAKAAVGSPTWSDDFTGAAGSPPNPARWKHDIGGNGWGNNEREYYTDSTNNASLDGNGNLVITARRENPAGYSCHYGACEYTSARLLTAGNFTQAYGRFEARIRIPRGQGIWPAFWMLGNNVADSPWPNCGEIDIMENIGQEPGTNHGSLHGPGYSSGNSVTGVTSLSRGQALGDDFHTYAVDWAPDSVAWSLDGVQYLRKTPADTRGNRWVFDHPFFMILNIAVGGQWPGSPGATTSFPQQMVVDYVRVYARPAATNPAPSRSAAPSAAPASVGEALSATPSSTGEPPAADRRATDRVKHTSVGWVLPVAIGLCLVAMATALWLRYRRRRRRRGGELERPRS